MSRGGNRIDVKVRSIPLGSCGDGPEGVRPGRLSQAGEDEARTWNGEEGHGRPAAGLGVHTLRCLVGGDCGQGPRDLELRSLSQEVRGIWGDREDRRRVEAW